MSEHGVKTVEQILDQVTGFWRSAILWAAFDLNLAEHLIAGRDTAAAIAAAEGADERVVRILLNALCGMGFADQVDGRYKLEPVAEAVLPNRPGAMGASAPIWFNEHAWAAWARLPEVARSGKPVDPLEVDHPFWDIFARASFGVAQLQGMMAADMLGAASGPGLRVLDVGCGSGGVGYAFALANPGTTVTGLDGESVLEVAGENASTLGLSGRVTHKVTNVLEAPSFGEGRFDLAIVSHILHHCDEAAAHALLGKVSRALTGGGRILINEFVPDEERRRATFPLMFAVLMALGSPGDTYTLSELSAWLGAAGFEKVEHRPTIGYASAITATKR